MRFSVTLGYTEQLNTLASLSNLTRPKYLRDEQQRQSYNDIVDVTNYANIVSE